MHAGWHERRVRIVACVAVLSAALLTACAEKEDATPRNDAGQTGAAGVSAVPELRTFAYDCDDSTYVVASLDRATDGLWLFLPGQTVRLPHAPAASGEKYSDGSVTFWMKGRDALLETPGGRTVRCTENRRESWFEDAKLRGMDFRAVGNEPGWTLELGPAQSILVTDYGTTRYEFATPVPEVDADGLEAVYRATADGTEIVIRTTWEPCTDSMDGSRYSHRVEVQIGEKSLVGCGRGLH
jgi:uncharacterized membrane protein/membrane-bound inhibitor of C-type lysozyme